MNRRGFFKGIGAVTATTIIAPHVILAETPPVPETVVGTEGLWTQLQRAKCVPYGGTGGITREHIQEAVEYVFRNHKPLDERFARVHTGTMGRKQIREKMHAYIINGVTYTT